jgi:uncharacterized delta-60 repeat protein
MEKPTMIIKTPGSLITMTLLMVLLTACGGGSSGGSVDKTNPQVTVTAPAVNSLQSAIVTIQWNTVDDNSGTVDIAVSNDGGGTFLDVATDVTDTGSYEWNSIEDNPFVAGDSDQYQLRIIARDIPGNTSSPAFSGIFELDNTPPQVSSSMTGDLFVSGTTELSWETTDTNAIQGVSVLLSTNGGSTFPETLADSLSDTGTFNWDTTAHPDGGGYKVKIIATDIAGNASESGFTLSADFTVDNTPPVVANGLLAFSDINNNQFNLSWTKADDALGQENLQYRLFYSETNNITDVAGVTASGTAHTEWISDINTRSVLGLIGAPTFYWNVVVRDQAGNMVTYRSARASGIPDNTLATDGSFSHHNAGGGDGSDIAYDVAIDSQGRIVTTGLSAGSSGSDMALWRIYPDGTLDVGNPSPGPDFDLGLNGQGYVTHNNAAGGNGEDIGQALAIDADGYIWVTGTSSNGSDNDMVIWKYHPFGSLQPETNLPGGIKVFDSIAGGSLTDTGRDIAIDNAGNVVVVGDSWNGSDYDLYILRMTPTGSLDTTFNTDGKDVRDGLAGGSSDSAFAVKIDSSNRILVAGSSSNANGDDDIVILRYLNTGILDSTFGNGGVVVYDGSDIMLTPTDDDAYGITVDNKGRVVVTGRTRINVAGFSLMTLMRLNEDGTPDTTFNDDGVVTYQNSQVLSGNAIGNDVAVNANGRIYVTGNLQNSGGKLLDMALWIYDTNGDLDASANGTGSVFDHGAAGGTGTDSGNAALLDADEFLVISGYSTGSTSTTDMTIWRFQ